MQAKLIVEGREFTIEIKDPELQKLLTPKKKTGYERVGPNESFYVVDELGVCKHLPSTEESVKDEMFENATSYSSVVVADNNARADKLMRQLRRFAVENRKNKPLWGVEEYFNCCIYYDYEIKTLECGYDGICRAFGQIYFDREDIAKKAIETFHDELIWYFTEYKDSL